MVGQNPVMKRQDKDGLSVEQGSIVECIKGELVGPLLSGHIPSALIHSMINDPHL